MNSRFWHCMVIATLCVCNVYASTYYVDAKAAGGGSGTEALPFKTIQEAVDVSAEGDVILVKPGTYAPFDCRTGSSDDTQEATTGDLGHKNITVRSTGGAAVTIIDAQQATRCAAFVRKDRDSLIDGFTLRNGSTIVKGYKDGYLAYAGGGVYFGSISNCIIEDCEARNGGGIAYSGKVSHTIIRNCRAYYATMSYGYGGGIYRTNSVIDNCLIVNNTASGDSGGCDLYGTTAEVVNSTIAYNSASMAPADVYEGTYTNCIICNSRENNAYNYKGSYNCIYPGPTKLDPDPSIVDLNFYAYPFFVDASNGDFRLLKDSPCLDAGDPATETAGQTDLAGQARQSGNRVDCGAYEGAVQGDYVTVTFEVNGNGNIYKPGDHKTPLVGGVAITKEQGSASFEAYSATHPFVQFRITPSNGDSYTVTDNPLTWNYSATQVGITNITAEFGHNTFYVNAATGDNGNPGTEAKPFKTIQRAVDSVYSGDTVRVAAGTYPPFEIKKTGVVFSIIGDDVETVIVDGGGKTNCMRVPYNDLEKTTVTVENITF